MRAYRHVGLLIGMSVVFASAAAHAQTVAQFLETADRSPRNPSAMLHPGFRRLRGQLSDSFRTIRQEQNARVARSQPRTICLPDSVPIEPQALLNRFNAIPPARRDMTVTQAVREWMAERYPC